MEEEWRKMSDNILHLTLEIITLLTGERCAVVKMASIEGLLQGLYPPLSGEQHPITAPPATFRTPERNIEQKVLEVICQVMELLTGGERKSSSKILEHSGGYKKATMEVNPTGGSDKRTSLERRLHPPHHPGVSTQEGHPAGGSDKRIALERRRHPPPRPGVSKQEVNPTGGSNKRTTLKRQLHPLHSGGFTQVGREIPHSGQIDDLVVVKIVDSDDEDACIVVDQPGGGSDKRTTLERRLHPPHHPRGSTQEDHPADGFWERNPPEGLPHPHYSNLFIPEEHEIPHHVQNEEVSLGGGRWSADEIKRMEAINGQDEISMGGDQWSVEKVGIMVTIKDGGETSVTDGQRTSEEEGRMKGEEASFMGGDRWSTESAGSLVTIKEEHKDETLVTGDPWCAEEVGRTVANVSSDPWSAEEVGRTVANVWSTEQTRMIAAIKEQEKRREQRLAKQLGNVVTIQADKVETSLRGDPRTSGTSGMGKVGMAGSINQKEHFAVMVSDHSYQLQRPPEEAAPRQFQMGPQALAQHCPRKLPAAPAPRLTVPHSTDRSPGLIGFKQKIQPANQQQPLGRDQPFSCSYCGKLFAMKSYFLAHVKTHTAENRHVCLDCGKAFNGRWKLNRHRKQHTGEKPFACTLCPYRSAFKHDLILHVRTHTGERPFGCPVCGQNFRRRVLLNKHRKMKKH